MLKKILMLSLILLILVSTFPLKSIASSTTPTFTWEADISKQSKDLNCVTYDKKIFVAVGNEGEIITSTDANKWTRQNSPIYVDWKTVTSNGNVFVAGGKSGDACYIITSKDGILWSITYLFSSVQCSIDYAVSNGKSFVLSGNGLLLYSKDGYNWESYNDLSRDESFAEPVTRPIWDGSKYCIFHGTGAGDGRNPLLSRTDKSDWAQTAESEPIGAIDSFLFLNGKYYISYKLYYDYDAYNERISSSTDLSSWKDDDSLLRFDKVQTNNPSKGIYGFMNSELYKQNGKGGFDLIYHASNDITLNSAVSNGKSTIAVGSGGAVFKIDKPGKAASIYPKRLYTVNAATVANNKLFTVGEHGQIASSSDGKNWTKLSSGTQESLNDILWTGKKFIAVGDNGTIIISKDGKKWNGFSVSTSKLNKVFEINGRFFAIGENSTILYSKDGDDWEICYLADGPSYEMGTPISRLFYINKNYVAPYDDFPGIYLASKDGINWSFKTDSVYKYPEYDTSSVIYKEKGLQLKGDKSGAVSYSPEGIIWLDANSPKIKFDQTNSYSALVKVNIPDYHYGPVKAITKFKGKYYIFHQYSMIFIAKLNVKVPSASPVSIHAFGSYDPDNWNATSEILDVQPIFQNNTILMDTDSIKKYCNADTTIDTKQRKVSISLNGNTAVYYTNSTLSYLNGKKFSQKVNAVLKDKRYYVEAYSLMKTLGFRLTYEPGKRCSF